VSRFLPGEAFAPAREELALLPLRFEALPDGRVLVANAVGDLTIMAREALERIVALDVVPGDGLYEKAASQHLIGRRGGRAQLELLALRLRSRMSFLREATPLHIFVVTLRCEHSCPYCQVSRRSSDKARYDMDEATAMRALDVALASPTRDIKVEFQGGEPLLNFELVKRIVLAARQRAPAAGKRIEFVVTTNLALLDEQILAFCGEHEVLLSTSLDGPEDLHNRNRPRPGGNSHQLAVAGIRRIQETLGPDRVGALMTTPEASLDRPEEIVDEYLRLGLDGIFLRPLSPYGFAVKTKWIHGYDAARWLAFYERGLRHVLALNKAGTHFPELYAAMLVQRILTDRPLGYVDLRSPSGAGLGALVYNYDGRVFASDEGRMLAEMGDDTFCLGDVRTHSYHDLILSDRLVDTVARSLTQSAPMCSTCAFEAHCGADPVFHHTTQGDVLGIKPVSDFCARQKGILRLLVDMLQNSPEDAAILRRWAMA
jgi:His-Xaa-Ser system radical SAM maturase HxsB